MTERYYYQTDLIGPGDMEGALDFAATLTDGQPVYIFIAVKTLAEAMLGNVFAPNELNKMTSGQPVTRKGGKYLVESGHTFDPRAKYPVVLAFHASQSLLEKMESGEVAHLIVFNNEIDEPTEWMRLAPHLLNRD